MLLNYELDIPTSTATGVPREKSRSDTTRAAFLIYRFGTSEVGVGLMVHL